MGTEIQTAVLHRALIIYLRYVEAIQACHTQHGTHSPTVLNNN